jgi:hypothetical protein
MLFGIRLPLTLPADYLLSHVDAWLGTSIPAMAAHRPLRKL